MNRVRNIQPLARQYCAQAQAFVSQNSTPRLRAKEFSPKPQSLDLNRSLNSTSRPHWLSRLGRSVFRSSISISFSGCSSGAIGASPISLEEPDAGSGGNDVVDLPTSQGGAGGIPNGQGGAQGGAGGTAPSPPYENHWIGEKEGESPILSGGFTLPAYLAFPAPTGSFPAAVLMHGCGGFYKNQTEMGDDLSLLMNFLLQLGFAVLVLDSFTSRGYDSVCNTGGQLVHEVEDRVPDAFAALSWLQSQDFLRHPQEVIAVGFSHGGSAVMASLAREGLPDGVSTPLPGGFAAGIAFYPGCGFYSEYFGGTSTGTYFPTAPLLMPHAGLDSLLTFCQNRATRAAEIAQNESIENLFLLNPPQGYPNASHGFMRCSPEDVTGGQCAAEDLAAQQQSLVQAEDFLRSLLTLD